MPARQICPVQQQTGSPVESTHPLFRRQGPVARTDKTLFCLLQKNTLTEGNDQDPDKEQQRERRKKQDQNQSALLSGELQGAVQELPQILIALL